jgi:cytochrome c-type biogenesis protein CcmH
MRALFVIGAVFAFATPALASEQHPTLSELEGEVMCLVCNTTLDQSHSAFANRERVLIRKLIARGETKSQIKQDLVDQFGPQILAAPPRSGFNLLAWWLPIAGAVAAALVLGFLAWRWSRGRREPRPLGVAASANGRVPDLEPELERRLDEELARFDA